MNYWKTVLAAGAVLWLCAPIRAQELGAARAADADPGYAAYIAARQTRLARNLQERIAGINRRFSEEMSFRAKLKDERIAFEEKMEKQENSFLGSLKTKDPPARMAAWSIYYDKTGKEREEFYASLRRESREFWDARMAASASAAQASAAPVAK